MISDEKIMGFVEGEGCFNIGIGRYIDRKPRKTRKKNIWKKKAFPFKLRPSFRVVCANRDRHILEQIRFRLGVGEIYVQNRRKHKGHQNVAHYYVQSFADLVKVKEFFESHQFHTTKGKDFRLWAKCLEIILSGNHLKKRVFYRFAS